MDPQTPRLPRGAAAHRDLVYSTGGHPRQTLDLYVPSDGTPPVVIWIHGGAFRAGNKEDRAPLHLLAEGYAVAAINYRLSQHAVFPAQLEDCKAAVRWLRAHAQHYDFDPRRFAAYGESAGGYLAAMLGVTGHTREFDVGDHLEQPSTVQAVIDLNGPSDFLQMDAHRLEGGMLHSTPDSPESQLIGGLITEHPDRVARASPLTYVAASAPPFLIVHGDQDPIVPHHQSRLLVDALRDAGASAIFRTVAGGGHGNFSDPQLPAMTLGFLEAHLKPISGLK